MLSKSSWNCYWEDHQWQDSAEYEDHQEILSQREGPERIFSPNRTDEGFSPHLKRG